MIEYATPDELASHIDPDADDPTVPPKARKLIRRASALVSEAISGAVYSTNPQGLPTAPDVLEAVRDATCEQAAAWAAANIDPTAGAAALKPIPTTKALVGASVSYGQSADIQAALVELAEGKTLIPSAWSILVNAGLVSNRVGTAPSWGRHYNLTPTSPFVLGDATLGS